ncbi:MAG TPA: adenylate/guanylate cyclase domain-containing protein [Mucilaginibacter sp.]|jgi:class 3 adenylate cyclase|nr:adenylate/guanylate cyclase domain-containing protein [Mucilaginibacter sp.]
MNVIRRFIDIGTSENHGSISNKYVRFINSVTLFVWLNILGNLSVALYFHQSGISLVLIAHFLIFVLIPIFNRMGRPVLAAAWFSALAILFVTFYAVDITLYGLNFAYLPMIIFLQFFMFPPAYLRYIVIFIALALAGFVLAILWPVLKLPLPIAVSQDFINAQRLNTLFGLPALSIAFGAYAFFTINKAEHEVAVEKEKSDRLLLGILPASIAERFKDDQSFLADGYDSVTVLFADIVGFTQLSGKISPTELVKFLDGIFLKFDELTEAYGLEKIKTIGDAYMVAGGVPTRTDDHPHKVCEMALRMTDVISGLTTPAGEPLQMRIGIHTGPLTAGVIGAKKFAYDLWGDTVNTASRMESHCEAGKIQITGELYELVKDKFDCIARGTVAVKGKGSMSTWFLVSALAA